MSNPNTIFVHHIDETPPPANVVQHQQPVPFPMPMPIPMYPGYTGYSAYGYPQQHPNVMIFNGDIENGLGAKKDNDNAKKDNAKKKSRPQPRKN